MFHEPLLGVRPNPCCACLACWACCGCPVQDQGELRVPGTDVWKEGDEQAEEVKRELLALATSMVHKEVRHGWVAGGRAGVLAGWLGVGHAGWAILVGLQSLRNI